MGETGAFLEMVVGEGLFVTSFLTLRAVASDVVSRCSTRTLVEGSHPSPIGEYKE
jgi:hypothetical protein